MNAEIKKKLWRFRMILNAVVMIVMIMILFFLDDKGDLMFLFGCLLGWVSNSAFGFINGFDEEENV